MPIDYKDRVKLLQRVAIFEGTPMDSLEEIAAFLEELHFSTGEVIFHKGEPGSCLYVISRGSVLVHDGNMQVNYLHTGDIFGEMAVLDPQPRSASVTTTEPTHLLRLERSSLYQVMGGQPEILQGVVRMLSQRLRKQLSERALDFEYIQQFERVIDAALAVDAGVYAPDSLNGVAQRSDQLGRLARVFQHMAQEVYSREQRLKQQVAALRIEIDESKRSSQVAEITETDYFHSLQQRAEQLRQMRSKPNSHSS